MLTALTGDPAAGRRLLDEGAPWFESTGFLQMRTTYLRARSLVSLMGGDLEDAYQEAAAAVAADPAGINSPLALALQARSALWLHDAERIEAALPGTLGFHGRWMAIARLTAEAGLAALEGRREEAAAAYRRALDAWRALDVPFDLALCALDRALLDGEEPAAAAAEARDLLGKLGATPLLRLLEDQLAPAGGAPGSAS